MIDRDYTAPPGTRQPLLDELLRAGIPEIKLALGEVIDRENARPLPPRYARLLPDTVLIVTLRPDAAEAVQPIATDLERELTDSCNRHGSLYDRRYRVRLQRAEDADAPLYSVAAHAGQEAAAEPLDVRSVGRDRPSGEHPRTPEEAPSAAREPSPATTSVAPDELPITDPDATVHTPEVPAGWADGQWVLIVENDDGEAREVFRIADPIVTVGRGSADSGMQPSIAISDAPHVSRRQLALTWQERDGAPGFSIHNLGLNTIHLPGQDLPGARIGKGRLDLSDLAAVHVGWLPPGVPARIGEHGPTLRIEEVPPDPEVWIDPDATVFD